MNIAIVGGLGRMGRRVIENAYIDEDFDIKLIVESSENENIGKKIKDILPSFDINAEIVDELKKGVDVVIDFSSPNSTMKHLRKASELNLSYVICTTGFNDEQEKEIIELSKKIPVCKSPNMSLGVNFMFELVRNSASVLGKRGYDIEIYEIHHNKKKDSPSGTAKKLLECAAEGAGLSVDNAVYGRKGIVGERRKNEIGVMAIRCGGVVGEHTVILASENERIEIIHRAGSRDVFAQGALEAARFLFNVKKSGLYSMKDVLGL